MATSTGNFIDDYYGFWDSVGDPRVKHWFLMRSPEPGLIIIAVYLLFVKKIGPKWMENREPYDMKNVIIVYNIIQVIACSYIFYYGSVTAWMTKYKWFCEPVDYSMNPDALTVASLCYYYYLTKLLDLLDTIFFVLRKKNNQITVLHLFHHTIMVGSIWFPVKIRPGGTYSFLGYINSFVHIIMYAYYLLAAMGPQVKKYLWWKKYLTTLQMGQFVLVLLHTIPHFFIKDCDMPKGFIVPLAFIAATFLIMFANFYRMEYMVKPKKVNQLRNGIKSKTS